MEQPELHWYALKVFFNKVFEMEALVDGMGLESFIPVRKVQLKGNEHFRAARQLSVPDDRFTGNPYVQEGPVIYRREPVVNSLFFVRAPGERIPEIENAVHGRGFVYKMTDHERPAVIPDREMGIFKLVCTSGAEGLEFFSEEDMTRYRKGDRVRVLEGPLKGAEGYIRRIRKDRRLLVAIEGFIAVATTFIPPQFLEKVKD
ncbi:MAG: transcriptional regulator [Bacteroidales bacterium]|nr:transcriptional regulator [Bacteroidales bacterium]